MASGYITLSVKDSGGVARNVEFWSSDGTTGGTLVPVSEMLGDDGAAIQGTSGDSAWDGSASTVTRQSYIRYMATKLGLLVFGAGTSSAAQRVTHASDDPAVATLGATSGAAVITDANGTVQQYLRGIVKLLITAGTVVLGAGSAVIGKTTTDQTTPGTTDRVSANSRLIDVAFTTLTRPANTTAYSINDSVSDNATAASVTTISTTVADLNDAPVLLSELRLDTNDTGLANGCQVRAYLFNSDPTASSGVQAGDNAAWSNKRAGFFGSMSGTFRVFSDGGRARLVPDEGAFIIAKPVTGGTTIYIQYQTLSAFTPSANSTTIDARMKGFQGRV